MSNLQQILTNINPLSFLNFLITLYFLYKWLFSSSRRKLNSPPSPPKLPILGHLHKLGQYPHRALRDLSRQYGELMLVHLGSRPTVIVSSANAARAILKTHDSVLSNRPYMVKYDKLFYNCRDLGFTAYGEYWRQMKSVFVLKLLSNKRVRSYRRVREEETAVLIENIRNSNTELNLSEMFTTLTNHVICRVAFGRKYSGEEQQSVDFREFMGEFNDVLGVFNVGDFIPWMGWINRFNGLYERMDKTSSKFDMLLEEVIREHSDSRSNLHGNCEETMDFVDVLLEAQRKKSLGFPIETESIKALIILSANIKSSRMHIQSHDAFGSGTHTSAAIMEWAMAELLRNPSAMEKLQQVRGIVKDEDVIQEETLDNMKYLKAVIKETLRLHPPAPLLIPRESTQTVKMNGYDIAAKTMVIINTWAIQRDPKTWDEPEEFRPERFLNSAVDFKGQDFELLPFGGGRRICPAISFTIATNEIVLANLVHKFNWSLPDGAAGDTLDMSEGNGIVIRMKKPVFANATPHTYQ